MTQEEAEKELYSYLTPEEGAMISIGYVDNLINKIYKDLKNEYLECTDIWYKLGYYKGFIDKSNNIEPLFNLKHFRENNLQI